MEVRSQPLPENICIFFRQYFCCRRKRRWNPINKRKPPKVRREKSVTFAVKVNKVEPLRYESTFDESGSEDNSEHRFHYEERLRAAENRSNEENASTTALLDERLSDRSSSDEGSEYDDGEILTLEDFVEKYVKDTIAAALNQFKKDRQQCTRASEVQKVDEEEPE